MCEGSQFLKQNGEPKSTKSHANNIHLANVKDEKWTDTNLLPITVAGSRAEFSVKRSVAEKNWDAGKVKGNTEDAPEIN